MLQFLLCLICVCVASGLADGCKPDWVQLGNKCYHFHHTPHLMIAAEAKKTCENEGGMLATPKLASEARLIEEYLQRYGKFEYFISAIRLTTNSHTHSVASYVWPDGSSVDTSANWAQGEPSPHLTEDCVAIMSNGLWNNIPCSLQMPFICEELNVEITDSHLLG